MARLRTCPQDTSKVLAKPTAPSSAHLASLLAFAVLGHGRRQLWVCGQTDHLWCCCHAYTVSRVVTIVLQQMSCIGAHFCSQHPTSNPCCVRRGNDNECQCRTWKARVLVNKYNVPRVSLQAKFRNTGREKTRLNRNDFDVHQWQLQCFDETAVFLPTQSTNPE